MLPFKQDHGFTNGTEMKVDLLGGYFDGMRLAVDAGCTRMLITKDGLTHVYVYLRNGENDKVLYFSHVMKRDAQ